MEEVEKKLIDQALENALVQGRQYQIGSRMKTNYSLAEILEAKSILDAQQASDEAGSLLASAYTARFDRR